MRKAEGVADTVQAHLNLIQAGQGFVVIVLHHVIHEVNGSV